MAIIFFKVSLIEFFFKVSLKGTVTTCTTLTDHALDTNCEHLISPTLESEVDEECIDVIK